MEVIDIGDAQRSPFYSQAVKAGGGWFLFLVKHRVLLQNT